MAATTTEYRLVHPVTGEEQLRFRVTDDVGDPDYLPVVETLRADDGWKTPENGYIATGLYLNTIDGTTHCEKVGKAYSRS